VLGSVAGVARRIPYLSGFFAIAVVCGLIDAACFLALGGVFAEVMTGNMALLAFQLGTGESIGGGSPVRYLVALGAFAVGALAGGLIQRGPTVLFERRLGFAMEGVLLVAATSVAVVTGAGSSGAGRNLTVALLCVAMGLQNALMRMHGVSDLATNLTTITYMAIVADSSLARGTNPRFLRRAGSVLLFIGGATLGAWLTRWGAEWPLIVATGLFVLALVPILGSDPTTTVALPPQPAAAS
jgi:uncharacterized membrane protein YoaK (UPF0700 family)